MGISEREHYIKVLEKMFYSMEKLESGVILPTSEVKTALAYAISSLKTDLKYDLMYEGEEIYTKDEVIAMLTELQDELKYTTLSGLWKSNYAEGFNDSVATSVKKIQCRIDKLKENME